MENVIDFKFRLKEAMNSKKITQSKLAEMTNINSSTINEYLKGKYEPNRERISKFAEVLNVNEVWLMGYDVSKEIIIKLKNYEKEEILNKIEEKARIKNINKATLKKTYGIIDFSISLKDEDIIRIAKDFKIPLSKENYLSKNIQSEDKKWFYDILESLDESEISKLKEIIEPMINLIKK